MWTVERSRVLPCTRTFVMDNFHHMGWSEITLMRLHSRAAQLRSATTGLCDGGRVA